MSLHWKQQRILHEYARLAGLGTRGAARWQYEVFLREHSEHGCTSTTDQAFGEGDFDRVMPMLERRAEARVLAGETTWPAGIQPTYWRRRLARDEQGFATNRQVWRIERLWAIVGPELGHTERDYLLGIVRQACGLSRAKELYELRPGQAALVIDALRGLIKRRACAPAHEGGDGAPTD